LRGILVTNTTYCLFSHVCMLVTVALHLPTFSPLCLFMGGCAARQITYTLVVVRNFPTAERKRSSDYGPRQYLQATRIRHSSTPSFSFSSGSATTWTF